MRISDWCSDVCSSDLHVADRRDVEPDRLQRAQRRFTAGAGALDLDLEGADAMLSGFLAGVFGTDLRGIGGRLAAALEAHHAGARPGDGVALRVGDRKSTRLNSSH